MNQNHFWNLLAKKLSGDATAAEEAELEDLIKAHPELTFPAQHIADLWTQRPLQNLEESKKQFRMLASKLNISLGEDAMRTEKILPPKKSKKLWPFLLLAAALSFAFFLSRENTSREKNDEKKHGQIAEVSTPPHTRSKVVLPDSSVVWLNAGSKLTYPAAFGDIERTVTLSGEGFFDVVKSNKPFVIHTSGIQIKVLGTAFNVRNYPSEKRVETSLVRGRVEITLDKSPGTKYILKPNEKLTLNTADEEKDLMRKKKVAPLAVLSNLRYYDSATIAETSWVENKLVFVDEPFETIAQKMERWYGVNILFKDESLKDERLTGAFEKQTVWQALEALQITVPFRFSTKENTIILTR